jgi:hypothetical protein
MKGGKWSESVYLIHRPSLAGSGYGRYSYPSRHLGTGHANSSMIGVLFNQINIKLIEIEIVLR